MKKQLNEQDLEKVNGGKSEHISNKDMSKWVGKYLWFYTMPSDNADYTLCGWVKILCYVDPYVYIQPIDQISYEKCMYAYKRKCALEPTTFNGITGCFKVDNGFWHMTYFFETVHGYEFNTKLNYQNPNI